MKVELVGALDYDKVKNILGNYLSDDKKIEEVLENIHDVEVRRHSEIVSTAGRLSRFSGDVLEVLKMSEGKSLEDNAKFAKFVISMGHRSIIDHDYLVFLLKNVSAIVEQSIISERFASFTIKSRREVDFSKAGYYVPDFHDNNDKILSNNKELKEVYKKHMDKLFDSYNEINNVGIGVEDARFVLPYSYYSNIMMGIDSHTLLDMIVKYTKTKYARISELAEFGNKLYDIASVYTPYLIPIIDAIPVNYDDEVDNFLDGKLKREDYEILDRVKLLNSSLNVDDTILISAIMRRYQYDYDKAKTIYDEVSKNSDFKLELMKKIAFSGDKLELSQVNFDFQIPISYAILTHLTRHRTHKIMVPDFVPVPDLTKRKTPPKIEGVSNKFYQDVYDSNKMTYDFFKSFDIRDEDLIYFILSGNMTNIVTNMDGFTVRHILELRKCNKAQWETRDIASGIHDEIKNLPGAENFAKILGPTCETQNLCHEGKECCGKIYTLRKKYNN